MNPLLALLAAWMHIIVQAIYAGFCRIGRANEDMVCKYSFELNGKTYTLMFVLDGHGSPSRTDKIINEIVIQTAKYLPALILQYLSEGASAEDAIKNAHLNLQTHFEEMNGFKNAGTCIGGALIFGNTCVAFNLGDITVGLVDSKGNHRELSKHHNAANPEERKRLENLGVYISPDGRIGNAIMVSGALGDVVLKLFHLMKTPHIETITLSPGDKIFVTSDGVIGGNGYGLTFTRVAELIRENCDEKTIVSNAMDSLHWVDPRSVDDASCMIYSHDSQAHQEPQAPPSAGLNGIGCIDDDDAQAPLSAGIGCIDDDDAQAPLSAGIGCNDDDDAQAPLSAGIGCNDD
jgi:serine/threonine protein phosphatase PrpC